MAKLEFTGVFFVAPTFVTYYQLKPENAVQFVYPPGSVVYQDVLSENGFRAAFETFLTQQALTPGKVLVLLSESLVYYEAIDGNNPQLADSEMDRFISYLPIPTEVLAKRSFPYQNATHLVAFDKRIFFLLKTILESAGWNISLVAPVSVFGQAPGDQLSWDALKTILKNEVLLTKSGFPFTTEPVDTSTAIEEKVEEVTKSKTSKKQLAMLGVCLLIFYVVSSYAIINSGFFGSTPERRVASMNEQRTTTPQVAPTTQPTVMPTSQYKEKTTLRVQINSASLSAVETAKVKTALETHGFTNIVTDGGQTEGNAGITIMVGSAVSPEIRAELPSLFSSSTSNVRIVNAPAEATVDVIVYIQ